MTKHRELAITLTPSMLAKVAALRQGPRSSNILQLQPESASAIAERPSEPTKVHKRQLLKQKAAMLAPMLPERGAKGRHYSRHAIARMFQVPYHMLQPHPE